MGIFWWSYIGALGLAYLLGKQSYGLEVILIPVALWLAFWLLWVAPKEWRQASREDRERKAQEEEP